jgi:hypothetical protein
VERRVRERGVKNLIRIRGQAAVAVIEVNAGDAGVSVPLARYDPTIAFAKKFSKSTPAASVVDES